MKTRLLDHGDSALPRQSTQGCPRDDSCPSSILMEQRILSLLAQKDYVPLSADNLQRQLRVAPDREPEFTRALRKLERDGKIACIKASRYVLTSDADLIPGRIRMNRAGKGFLAPDDS